VHAVLNIFYFAPVTSIYSLELSVCVDSHMYYASRYKMVGILLRIRPAQGRKRKLATANSMQSKDPHSLRQFSFS